MSYKVKEVLIELYISQNKSLDQVSKELNCNWKTIQVWLKFYNIKKDINLIKSSNVSNCLAAKKNKFDLRRYTDYDFMFDLYVTQNLSCKEISNFLNISNTTTKRWILKLKIFKNAKEKTDTKKRNMLKTFLKNYGVRNPMQTREVASKAASKMRNSKILFHWKTEKSLCCVGRYEIATVNYLNFNKIDFLWQPEAFTLPSSVLVTEIGNPITYRPDLFLIDSKIWIEIKGKFLKNSKMKWDWFHENYPNSELWNYDKLKSMKILK